MGALTVAQKLQLYKCHFIPSEVIAFDHATTPTGKKQEFDFTNPTWKSVLKSRMRWVKRLRARGKTDAQIDTMLHNYYQQKKDSTPFDMLTVAGSPSAKQKPESDASIARRLLALSKVQSGLGKAYAPYKIAILNKPIPRNIPRPPKD